MNFWKRPMAAMLILCLMIQLSSALAMEIATVFGPGENATLPALILSPSPSTQVKGEAMSQTLTAPEEGQNARVTWEIVSKGKTGADTVDTQDAVVCFTLSNPGTQKVVFDYAIMSGSAESGQHLSGDLSGTVTLSPDKPSQDVTIRIKPLADNPENHKTANNPNALWTGERIFYLFCSGISNGLFDGGRHSLTVPVPIESGFDYQESYDMAVATPLIDLREVPGGSSGVYPIPAGAPLTLTGEIGGHIRKMLDAGVFTDIVLPEGYLSNSEGEEKSITYTAASYGAAEGSAARALLQTHITVPEKVKVLLYSEEFQQLRTVASLMLGVGKEGNGIVSRLEFILEGDGVSAHFVNEDNEYQPNQVYFSDGKEPEVKSLSTHWDAEYYYGDQVPLTITFSEPVHTGNITFQVGGQSLRPLEAKGTISESVSFLYTLGDEGLGVSALTVEVCGIQGAKDLSGREQTEEGAGQVNLNIAQLDPARALPYCAQPVATVEQGTSASATVALDISLKADESLRTWLADSEQLDGHISKVLKAWAVTKSGEAPVNLTVVLDDDPTKATGLTGSFTAPENTTGEDITYAVEFYLDRGDGATLLYGLTAQYTIPALIVVDEESDVTLTYSGWPTSNNIPAKGASGLSLGYVLNVNATWKQSTYFVWASSNEEVATIDQRGSITVHGPGEVAFSLTITNPLSTQTVTLSTPTLTVIESGEAYLYVPAVLSKVDVLKGSDVKISFSTNITAGNEMVSPGVKTDYTITLYRANYLGHTLQRGEPVWQTVESATAAKPLTACTVPGAYLERATAKGVYGYILEIRATDMKLGGELTTEVFIRVREKPARAVLTRPASLYLTDAVADFTLTAGVENATDGTEYQLTVKRNSESAPLVTANAPGAVTVPVSPVNPGRLMDVYTLSLRVKNPEDEAWSADSYCVYVYGRDRMSFLVGGIATGSLRVELKPDLKDGEVYSVSPLRSRTGLGLSKSIGLNSGDYIWSNGTDQISWSIAGESASLWYGSRKIEVGESLTLPPGANLRIQGDGAGVSTVTATHARTGMSMSKQVVVGGTDKLYLFQSTPKVACQIVYTNGNGVEKTITAHDGSAGVYEESGIQSDVVFYPKDTAQYDFAVLKKTALDGAQTKGSAFDLYPVHTVTIPEINYEVLLSLFDEGTGEVYTGDITVRGGLYVNGAYYTHTMINGKMGNEDQTVAGDRHGRYVLSFNVGDYYSTVGRENSHLDELKYVIEVRFGTDYFPIYVTVENPEIQAGKESALGVNISQGMKKTDRSLVQNQAIVLAQSVTVDGKELSLDEALLKLETRPSQALLNMTLMLQGYEEYTSYYLHLMDGTGASLGYAERGTAEHAYPFSSIFTLRFSNDISDSLHAMLNWHLETGEKGYIYPAVEAISTTSKVVYQLSKPIRVQSLYGVKPIDWRVLDDIPLINLIESISPSYGVPSLSTGIDLVDEALGIGGNIIPYPFKKMIGLELSSTEDPLMYKGILRYAAGSEYADAKMMGGVYMNEDDPASYTFLPKSRFTGEGKTVFMERSYSSGNARYMLSGGAYVECLLTYNPSSGEWELGPLRGDLSMTAGHEYERRYNTSIGPVPVTAKFRTELSAEAGLTIKRALDGSKTTYVPRLIPSFGIYGSGGVGRDYKVLSLWAGPYGKAGMTHDYRWSVDSEGQKQNGQNLSISGEVGVAFEIKLGPLYTIDGEYELTSLDWSKSYHDYDEIMDSLSAKGMFGLGQAELTAISQTISYTDRSYLDLFERSWGARPSLMGRMGGEEVTETIQENTNPDAAPVLADDGSILVYLSDMDSADLRDTAAVFSVKDGSGGYPAATQISGDSPYPDSDLSLSGTAEGGAAAVWLRYFTDMSATSDEEATIEDAVSALASAEVMGAIYDPKTGTFTTKRLTQNSAPEVSPVTAWTGGKAVAAWIEGALGDLSNPLGYTSSHLMYAFYDGTSWKEAQVLYDGSLAGVTALSATMMENGTTAIVYQVTEEQGDSEIFCSLLDGDGSVLRTLRLTDHKSEDLNPQLTAVEFPDGIVRFVAGWNQVDESGQLSIQLSAVNTDGTLYPEFSLQLSEDGKLRDYDSFRFSKGGGKVEGLSLLWSEAESEDGMYKYAIYGAKPIALLDGPFSLSGRARLLELPSGSTLRAMDARTDRESGEIELVMVVETSGKAEMTTAMVGYENKIAVDEPQYLYADVVPGLELPVGFTLTNEGMEAITEITIDLGGNTFAHKDLNLLPGERKNFTILYTVPHTVADEHYNIKAKFGSGDETAVTGSLKLSLPDVSIGQIHKTKESGQERGFRIQVERKGYAPLLPDTHSVRLEVWGNPELEGTPLWIKTLSMDEINALNGGMLPVNMTLEKSALEAFLNQEGEIPEGGTWVYFRTVLIENGVDREDAESGNDLDYVQIFSLMEQYGRSVSLTSDLETEGGNTKLRVNATNNSMQGISNGSIVAILRDDDGNAIETLYTYDGSAGSLLSLGGESSGTVDLHFSRVGYFADVSFTRVSAGSARLSALNLTGVPLVFDSGVYDYTVQVYDLTATTITALSEDPSATVTVKRGSTAVSSSGPLSLPYGETVLSVIVTSPGGDTQKTYTIRIQNRNTQTAPSWGDWASESQRAELTIGDDNPTGVNVRIRGAQASVSLGELGQKIFTGDAIANLTMPTLSSVNRYLVELPAHALSGKNFGGSLTFNTPIAQITIPAGMLGAMGDLNGKTAGIGVAKIEKATLPDQVQAAVGDRPVFALTLTLDGVQTDWTNPDTPVTVSIPYVGTAQEMESPESLIIWYIDGSGNLNCVRNGHYQRERGTVKFQTTHFSLYAVGYNQIDFTDVEPGSWYGGAVRYLSARGITSGTVANTFSPDATLTRGQFITLLLRTYEIEPGGEGADNFADAGNTYYTGYLAAAKELGISQGVGGNKFAPEDAITRQQMFTLLYNALKVGGKLPKSSTSKTLSDFKDWKEIAPYAQEAMGYLVETGMVSGDHGALFPEMMTTRAQMAQVLYNLLGK